MEQHKIGVLSDLRLHPACAAKSSDLSNVKERKNEMFCRSVNDFLEKLSVKKFFVSASEVGQLDIRTEENLCIVIDVVFEKALSNPSFSIPFANMCKTLSLLKVPCSGQEGCFADIRKYLFDKCLAELKKKGINEQNREKSNSLIGERETDAKRKRLQEAFKWTEWKNGRHLGNIRFTGWLFKLNLFTKSMMHQFIEQLLWQCNEVAVESVCELLTTVGSEQENAMKSDLMDMTPAAMKGQVPQLQQQLIPATTAVVTRQDCSVADTVQYSELQCNENKRIQQTAMSVLSDQLRDNLVLSDDEEAGAGSIKESPLEQMQRWVALKFKYREDQWSPLNPEGKRQYDREFLLNLQSDPLSMKKPLNLPYVDVIKNKAALHKLPKKNSRASPLAQYAERVAYTDPFEATFARANAPAHPTYMGTKGIGSQPGLTNTSSVKTTRKTRAGQQVKLHTAEKAWRPPSHVKSVTDEEARTQFLFKKVQSILNKLTPQNFLTLVSHVGQLDITTEENLNGVVDLIFEKAVCEPKFSVLYAEMCNHLALLKVNSGHKGKSVFRKLLVTKCQREFEKRHADHVQNRAKRINMSEKCETDENGKQLQENFEEQERRNRRQLGNIRFIGELFKLRIMKESIMCQNIKKLLCQANENSLECLCCLLITIGKELENRRETNTFLMTSYITDMKKIVDERKTSFKVRFMLQDLIDLRMNNWVPRRDENHPTTIDRIRKEAEKEAHEQKQMLQQVTLPKRMPNDHNQRKNQPPTIQDGGNMSGKSSKGNYNSVDRLKLKLTKKSEFTTKQDAEPKLRRQIAPKVMGQNLQRLLRDHESNEEIFSWLERHIEGEMSPAMYRALVTAIYESVITSSGEKCELNVAKLKGRKCILARYMDANRNLELHAIFALQYLMNKLDHPKGLLLQIFDLAYTEDFLSDDAFKQWEKCGDPAEQEGKDAAVCSVSPFFTWLKEEEDESEDSD